MVWQFRLMMRTQYSAWHHLGGLVLLVVLVEIIMLLCNLDSFIPLVNFFTLLMCTIVFLRS